MNLQQLHAGALKLLRTKETIWQPELSAVVPRRKIETWIDDPHTRYYSYLRALVTLLQPNRVLELGTKDGISALFMLSALPQEAELVTIDLLPGASALDPYEADTRLKKVIADDLDLESGLMDAITGPIDLLFVDTDHTSDQVKREIERFAPYLRDDAVIVIDDIHLNPEMESWWESVEYEKIDCGLSLHHSGFGIYCNRRASVELVSPEKSKLAVCYLLHDDFLYLPASIESTSSFGDVFAFVSEIPWNGESGDWESAAKMAENSGANIVLGEWASEDEQRQAAQWHLRELGYTHALVPDGDEIIEQGLLSEIKGIAENNLADRVYVEWDTYWKTPEYVIRPRERFTPLMMIDLRNAFQLHLRDYGGGRTMFLDAHHGVVHHLSYCGPNSRIERKINSWSHTKEVSPDWFDHIWSRWDGDRTLRNLHPTHPEAYGFAERISAPHVLQRALDISLSEGPGELHRQKCPERPELWPTISIVIPVHGQATVFERCLKSLTEIEDLWTELIIVDNASEDRARQVGKNLPNTTVIPNDSNLGFGAACNQGTKQATGEVVLFLNSDTVVPRAGLIRLIESLTESNSIAAAGPLSNNVGHFQQVATTYTSLETIDLFADDFAQRAALDFDTDMLSGFCLAVRRDVLDEVGTFDERFGRGLFEDNDLCYRIRRAGYRLVVSAQGFVHHEGSATLGQSAEVTWLFEENRIKFEEKWKEDLEIGYSTGLSGTTNERIHFEPSRKPEQLKRELAQKARQAGISVCMIVKDEERVIANSLSSVIEVFPEVVVVDTGSTDRTKEIVCSFGANLIESTWHNSFSIARNESIQAASGKWIFWIDADDTVSLRSCEHLIQEICAAPSHVHAFVVPVQFVDEGPGAGTRVDHVKAFRKLPGVQFEGRIHEQVLPSISKHGGEVARSRAVVMHSGYDTSEEGQQKKSKREDTLLWLDHEERPDHPFPCFNLGMTFHYRGEHENAIKWLKKSIALCHSSDTILRKAYCLLGLSQRQQGKSAAALRTLKNGLNVAPNDIELHFQLALQLSIAGRHKDAIVNYQRCLELSSDAYYSSFDTGIRSFKTLHNIGAEYVLLAETEQAMRYFRMALDAGCNYVPSAEALFSLAIEKRDTETAQFAMEAVRAAEGMSERWAAMGSHYADRIQGEGTSRSFLERALQTNPNSIPVRRLLSSKLIADGDEAGALPHWRILAHAGVAESAYFMGVAMSRAGKFDEALTYMRKAKELNPAHGETANQIAALEQVVLAGGE